MTPNDFHNRLEMGLGVSLNFLSQMGGFPMGVPQSLNGFYFMEHPSKNTG